MIARYVDPRPFSRASAEAHDDIFWAIEEGFMETPSLTDWHPLNSPWVLECNAPDRMAING